VLKGVKLKKKIVAAITMAAMALTIAGASAPALAAKPSLTLWVDTPRIYAAELYKKAVASKIDVKIVTIAQSDIQTKIQLANTTKKGWPDVTFGDPQDTAQFAAPTNGFAANLTKVLPKSIVDGYAKYGNGNSDCIFQGQVFCLKNDLAATVLWYNVPVFKKLGLTVPKTMDEFAATAMKLKGTGYTAGGYGDHNYYASFLQSSECPLIATPNNNTVRTVVTAPACTRVAKLLQPLMDAGVIDKRSAFDPGFMKEYPNKGMVAMTLGPAWYGKFVIQPKDVWNMPAGTMTAAPMPKWAGAKTNTSGAWGGGVFIVSSHSKNPKLALEAATYLATNKTVQSQATGYPAFGPVRELWHKALKSDDYFAADPYPAMDDAAKKLSQLNRPVRFPFVAQVGTSLTSKITEGKPLAEALDSLAKGIQSIAPASGYKVVTK
jgi:multiple sugar transport system substrate-binding protein